MKKRGFNLKPKGISLPRGRKTKTKREGKTRSFSDVVQLNLSAKLAALNGLLMTAIVIGIFFLASGQANRIIEKEVMQKFSIISSHVTETVQLNNMKIESFASIIAKTNKVKKFGDQLSNRDSADYTQETHEILQSYVEANSAILDSIFITDQNGIVKAEGTDHKYMGQGFIDRGFFQQTKGGKATWSDIYESKLDGKLVRYYCVPLKNSAGAISGVIGAVVKMDYMYNLLNKVDVGDSGQIYLVDGQKKFAYAKEASLIGQSVDSLKESNLGVQIKNLSGGVSNQLIYTQNGKERICNYSPLDSMTLLVTIDRSEVFAPVKQLKDSLMGFGLMFMLIGVIAAFFVSRFIAKKIVVVQGLIKEVAQGDLTVKFEASHREKGDEIHQMGRSLTEMIESLRDMVSGITIQSTSIKHSSELLSQASEEGATAAQDIAEKVQEMAVGTQEQTRFAEETDELVKTMIHQLSEAVREMNKLVEDSNTTIESAKSGQVVIGKTIEQMNEIKKSSDESLAVMDHLISSSKMISNITEVIANISDQTNLLALNAAIEAARAGEAGRGFAVVAEEIRKLASQSQESANNIGKIVKDIQSEIDRANRIIQSEGQQVSAGIEVIESTEVKFNEIISKVNETAQTIMTLWRSISETESAGGNVIDAVEKINAIIQNMAANAQEISASSQQQNAVSEEISASAVQLTGIADDLDQVMKRFKI